MRPRNRAAACLVFACAIPAAALSAQAPEYDAIDSLVSAELRKARIPGAALVIVRGDRMVYARGFGRAGPDGAAVTPETPFYLGSTTKSFTALAVLQLVEAGLVELDAPVRRYLPWFTLTDRVASSAITVERLLLHRSGIPGRAGERFLSDPDTSPAAAERHVRRLADVRPGKGISYSNLNYTTLGLIVEAAAGVPLAAYLERNVFRPLGMRHTHTERSAAARDGLAAAHTVVLGRPVVVQQPANRGDLAAGYLMSSAADIGRYLIAQLNRGRVSGAPGVAPAVVAAMHRQRVTAAPDRELTYGFSLTTLGDGRLLDIAGSLPGYCSRFLVAPDGGWAVALLTNGNGAVAGQRAMDAALNVARLLAGEAPVRSRAPLVIALGIGAIIALPVVQLGLAVRAWRRLRPARGASGGAASGRSRRSAGAIVLGVGWGVFVLAGIPVLSQSYWATMRLYQPDISWALLASGAFGLGWAVTRAWLTWRP